MYKDSRGQKEGRYGNFHESKNQWGYEINIAEQDRDAFERVEGRYIERFLESAPLVLGYVDVAYTRRPHKGVYPSMNMLQAFRVSSRLPRAMMGDIPKPQVVVQPDFQVFVQSEFYPANVLRQLTPLAELASEGVLTILKLQKDKVAEQVAQDPTLDVAARLTQLAGRDLPRNVARELAEWAAHSDKFVLYEGFALFEGDEDMPLADPFTVERISPTLRIVHSPDKLLDKLEREKLAPLSITHSASALSVLPERARTIFLRQTQPNEPPVKTREPALLRRHTTITLHFPTAELLERFRRALLEVRCPVEADTANLTLTFAKRYEPQVALVIQALETDYVIRVEELE